ncbi:hypothetical protein MHBO_003444 [Bonamia ostreae]|uniref:eRF1/Pelota-like N-terminal domain-containing protein n=1 Tax=Bonamia ostreae TaxID=126728 RepID=A0ABV2AQI1_9EUKA
MKKLYFKIDRKQSGVVGLIPENKEDIWHLYNLISIGDKIQAFTDRKVVSTAKTNPSTFRVRIRLKIQIESINVDLDACSLRLSGRNKTLSPHIQLEQYHTITLQLNQKFEIDKEHWDVLSKNRLKMALNNSANAELAVILMDNGSANLYLIAPNLTLHKATVNVAIPKKRNYSAKKHSAVFNLILRRSQNFTIKY